MSSDKSSWQLRRGGHLVAELIETYLNWPWMECSLVLPNGSADLQPLLAFSDLSRSRGLEPLSPGWEAERVALLALEYELHAAPGTSSSIDSELDVLLHAWGDGTAALRPSSTPNVRNCCRVATK